MSYENIKSDFHCIGGRRLSSIISFEIVITKTARKIPFSKCVKSNRKISMTVSDNTIAAENSGKMFKKLYRSIA